MEDKSSYRRCKRCGLMAPIEAFRLLYIRGYTGDRLICRLCEQHDRDVIKNDNRERDKAHRTIRRHFERYKRKWKNDWGEYPRTVKEFCDRFGWDAKRIEQQFRDARVCLECEKPFRSEDDKQIDINDPAAAPYFGVNTRIALCGSCNQRKGRTPPEHWARMQSFSRIWKPPAPKVDTQGYFNFPVQYQPPLRQ